MMLVVNSPANEEDVRDAGLISGSRRSPVFLPGESHGQRSLACYSLWGHNESDTPERQTLTSLSRGRG